MNAPRVIVFDVNETLSDLGPLSQRFSDIGLSREMSQVWFASVLRDGFALSTVGASEKFAVIGSEVLRSMLVGHTITEDVDAAIQHVLEGFGALSLHPDVPEGIKKLKSLGLRLVTLTNGATAVSERLLSEAGLRIHFERLMSVEDAGLWKPAYGAYKYAQTICEVAADDMLLVAVHPWDINGAADAGLSTAWINRSGKPYPSYFKPPDFKVAALGDLAEALEESST